MWSIFNKNAKSRFGWLGSRSKPNVIAPDHPFYAIGDIHGRLDLLEELLAQIDPAEDQQLVFLGDYVDRGPDSAGTLGRLFALSQSRPGKVVCLLGNHEKMMLDFLDDPLGDGAAWLRNGATATLNSYGIRDVSDQADRDAAMAICTALKAALPGDIGTWLRELPLSWNSGNIWCVHAAMDPATSPQKQRPRTLLWGHRDFLKTQRIDDVCVVHGHTIVRTPENHNSRIAVDTGAHRTDRLTAAYIATDTCDFIQTGSFLA